MDAGSVTAERARRDGIDDSKKNRRQDNRKGRGMEKKFYDEEILKKRQQANKEKYNTLSSGMYIKNEIVYFKRELFFSGTVSAVMPEEFVDMPPNLPKLKYTSQFRPPVIKTSLDTTVNFMIGKYANSIQRNDVANALEQIRLMIKKRNPSYIFYDSAAEKQENTTYGWLEFKSFGLDEDMYNRLFILPVPGGSIQGSFNCAFADAEEWREASHQMVLSIQSVEEDK